MGHKHDCEKKSSEKKCSDTRANPDRGPRGPQGPQGPQGPGGAGINLFAAELTDRVDLPAGTDIAIVSVPVGDATSPARTVDVVASLSGISSVVPNSVRFFLRVGATGVDPGGSEITFTSVTTGQSGTLTRRILLPAGPQVINLAVIAAAPGVRIDPVARSTQDHATILVFEPTTP